MRTPTHLGFLLGNLLAELVTALPTSDPSQLIFLGDDGLEASQNQGLPLREQNDTICDAGSRQWTGLVPLDERRDMFFWYFESRRVPEEAPLIIWLNGGPGASSLLGAFHEIGPCRVNEDGSATSRSENSWTEFANMLFIDQPVGVGFSDPQDSTLWSKNLRESAGDLDKFLDVFLGEYFPQLSGRPVHLAGESFGGKYCPVYADQMRRKFDSVILVDALVDFSDAALGLYEHFCAAESASSTTSRGLDESTCAAMAAGYATCAKHGALCTATYDQDICATANDKCAAVLEPYMREVVPGGQDPYDDREECIDPPMCGRLGMEQVAAYLNREAVQQALGFSQRRFEVVNMRFNALWSQQGEAFVPTTREMGRLLDEKQTRILVLNGNNDAIVSTEGVLRSYNSIYWSGQGSFATRKLKPWFAGDTRGKPAGRYKTARNLTVVTVNEAGHMAPHDQPVAVAHVVKAWLRESSPFQLASEGINEL